MLFTNYWKGIQNNIGNCLKNPKQINICSAPSPERRSVRGGGVCCWRGGTEGPVYAPRTLPCHRRNTTPAASSGSLSGCDASPGGRGESTFTGTWTGTSTRAPGATRPA